MKISKVIFHIKPIPSHPWWECKNFNTNSIWFQEFYNTIFFIYVISEFQFLLVPSQCVQWFLRVFERSTDYCIQPLNCILYVFNWFWSLNVITWNMSTLKIQHGFEIKNLLCVPKAQITFIRSCVNRYSYWTKSFDSRFTQLTTSPYTSEFYATEIHLWTFNISKINTVILNNF